MAKACFEVATSILIICFTIIVVLITVEVMVQIIVNGYQKMRDKRKKRLDKMTDKRFGEDEKANNGSRQ